MKKAMTFMVLALLLFLAVGCTSVGAVLKSNVTGLPYWYYDPSMGLDKTQTAMIGEGSAETQRQAELLAYTDIINKLSERLGYTLSQETYRELSVLGTISDFGLSIEDTFMATQEGKFNVYMQVAIDSELLQRATTDENKRRESVSLETERLVLEGDEYVKAGKELRAVSNYLKAMALSYDQEYVDSEYSFDELYPVVYELLSGINLSIVSSKPSSVSCNVVMTRMGKFVSSAVSSAEVMASYYAEDTKGELYNDYFVYVTNDDGQISFKPVNDAIIRQGEIRFEFDIGSELDQLAAVAGEEKVAPLRELVNSKAITFRYSKAYSMGTIATAVIEHDEHGYVTGSRDISDYVAQKFKDDGAEATPFYAELDEEEDVLYEFTHSGMTEDCLLIIRVGQTSQTSSRTGVEVVGAEGIATLYSREGGIPLYVSDVIYSSAFAETYEEALIGAFKKLADIAYTLVKAVYV